MQSFRPVKSEFYEASYSHIASEYNIDKVFKILDKNCDGKLSMDEIKQGFLDFEQDISDKEIKSIFIRADVD